MLPRQSGCYVSCMRLNGVPLLPPIVSDDDLQEARRYRNLAVAVEGRLRSLRERNQHRKRPHRCASSIASGDQELEDDSYESTAEEPEPETPEISQDLDDHPGPGKPSVPTTLDIVPITLDTRIDAGDGGINPDTSASPPKLVRQGSYTLETPSPMLLARMQSDDCPGYAPTPSASVKRHEWSLAQARTDWQQRPPQESVARVRRNSTCGTPRAQCARPRSAAKSLDCIQAMLTREVANDEKDRDRDRDLDLELDLDHERKRDPDPGKLGGSLGSLKEETPPRPRSMITSEKVLQVLKGIQETHERQMRELLERQKREQNLMQEEFERQQRLLLAQIKKSFPTVSLPLLAESAGSTPVDKGLVFSSSSSSASSSPSSSPSSAGKNPYRGTNGFQEPESGSLASKDPTRGRVPNGEPEGETSSRCSNVSRELFPLDSDTTRVPVTDSFNFTEKHIKAATVINAYARGYLVRRLMRTERVIAMKNTYKEALHCMLKLHVDAPLNLPELNFHQRLQLQLDAASMNIVELFGLPPTKRMRIISQDREIRRSRAERPMSARSYSFATQRTLARKKLRELGHYESPPSNRSSSCSATSRARCQTWASITREKRPRGSLYQGIRRSTSAGTVRKPWR